MSVPLKRQIPISPMMAEANAQNRVLGSSYLTLFLALLLRCCVSLHSYSGEKTPPMYGDYEAQRHWMEVTYNIPASDWYKNTEDNNLTYWGLDYPPLTAYHSFLCGLFASVVVPKSVSLHSSRGYESYDHKLFMRLTVFVVDLLIYVPAIYFYFAKYSSSKEHSQVGSNIFLALLYPGIVLIDYGHFQYNCVSLGLFIAAVACVASRRFAISSFLFCLAVNYKQMELYHSLPFFFYFLGEFFALLRKREFWPSVKFMAPIAVTVLSTFFVLWLPFLSSSADLSLVIGRIFPVARGLYEDKVATFWCVLNVFFKVHQRFDNDFMLKICFLVTVLSVLPSVCDLTLNPSVEKFKLSLVICSSCFFLFSYHVHEKSILLVAVPIILLFPKYPIAATWFLQVSTFSMLSLLIRDGLFLPYLAVFACYYVGCASLLPAYKHCFSSPKNCVRNWKSVGLNVSLLGCVILSFVSKFCQPPHRYPFLWPLLVSGYSFVHFIAFLFYFYFEQCLSRFVKKKIH